MNRSRLFEGLRHCLFASCLLPLASCLFPLACHAGLPRSWQVNAGAGRVVDLPAAFHGEEIALRADFLDPSGQPFALPEGDWKLYFQTNGMDALYFGPFPASASSNSVSAVFSPTNDPGAAQITGYLALPGSIYHAAFRLRFLPSPGATPNALPLPTPTLDFATTTILNPPWPAEISAATNALGAAITASANVLSAEITNRLEKSHLYVDDDCHYLMDLYLDNFGLVFRDRFWEDGPDGPVHTNYAYFTSDRMHVGSIFWPFYATVSANSDFRGFYLGNDNLDFSTFTGWGYNYGFISWTDYPNREYVEIAIPKKSGTFALTSDISSATTALDTVIRTWVDTHKWTWASITNAPTTWEWSAITGKPTTWEWSNITNVTHAATNEYGVVMLAKDLTQTGGPHQWKVPTAKTVADALDSLSVEMAALCADNTATSIVAAVEYIESPETVRTNYYTGVSRDTALRDGKIIYYFIKAQPTGAWTLQLTLADGSKTAALPVFRYGTTRTTTHFYSNQPAPLMYRNGAWYTASDVFTNSNTYNMDLVTYCRAAKVIKANTICCGTTNGYEMVTNGVTFSLSLPLLFCNGAQTANKTNGNNWHSYSSVIDIRNNYGGFASRRREPLYLLGSVNDADDTFTVAATGCPFSYEPVKPCIPLGWFNANADNSFCFLPGPLMRDDIPTKDWVDDEITIRLTTTNAYISVSNGVQRIYEVDGTNRTLKFEWDMGFASISNQVNTLVSQMLRKIEDTHTWSRFAASGATNLFPAAANFDTTAYFASSNVTWTASNGFAVMTSHLPANASGNASQFRIGLDADDWFGFEAVASYLVDASASGFSHSGSTTTISTPYDATYTATPPKVYFSESLAEPFAEISSGITWQHTPGAQSTVTITGQSTSTGFYYLKKEVAGGAIFRSTMPILPEGYRVEKNGSYVGTLQPDSIISITQGNRTYYLFAQEVQ